MSPGLFDSLISQAVWRPTDPTSRGHKAPGLLSYYEVILGQREELRALVVAGECFERQAQAGTGHPASSERLIYCIPSS